MEKLTSRGPVIKSLRCQTEMGTSLNYQQLFMKQ